MTGSPVSRCGTRGGGHGERVAGNDDVLHDVALEFDVEHQSRREWREEGPDTKRELIEFEPVTIRRSCRHRPAVGDAPGHSRAALAVWPDTAPRRRIHVGQERRGGWAAADEQILLHHAERHGDVSGSASGCT